MVKRKKPFLWLNRPKKRSINLTTSVTPMKTKEIHTPTTINYSKIYKSPITSLRKRPLTPQSSQKKSKRRLNLDSSHENGPKLQYISFDDFQNLEELSTPVGLGEFINIATDKTVIQSLSDAGLLHYFTLFFGLVKTNIYPLNNISLLLWLETVKWFSCPSPQSMWYFDETKRFWRAGYRLFHGKFLTFMSGPKAIGHVLTYNDRCFDTTKTEINFAVPARSSSIARNSDEFPTTVSPGIIYKTISAIKDSKNASTNVFMMCVDGKKVSPGLDNNFGDVDMFGYESSPTLPENIQRIQRERKLVEDIKIEIQTENNESTKIILDMLRAVVLILTTRIKESRCLKTNQEYGLEKLKERAGKEWKTSKYLYAISGIQAYLYRLKQFIHHTLENISKLCRLASELNTESICLYSLNPVVQGQQCNMMMLKSVEYQTQPVETRFIQQRTETWKSVREMASVTGSTMHNAIGLRSLKDQKQHYDEYVTGVEATERSEIVQTYMDHGVKNEPHAVATLAGRFMPLFFPDAMFTEEGCYLIQTNSHALIEVSPDGSIRSKPVDQNVDSTCLAGIEIKCPFPKENKSTIMYEMPKYYVCQCISEMKALNTKSLIFVCFTQESSTFFNAEFDEELWNMIRSEVEELYGPDKPKKPTRLRKSVKSIKEAIDVYVKTKVQLLAEIPSTELRTSDYQYQQGDGTPYVSAPYDAPKRRQRQDILDDLQCSLTETSDLVQTGYQLSRKKATEVMVWVLSNKNRHWSPEIPNSIPVAYGLKDYKFSANSLREACNFVLAECVKAGLKVPLLAFDGQWYSLMVRDADGNPLTKLQLQKDVWNDVCRLKKKDIVSAIKDLNMVKLECSPDGISVFRDNGKIWVQSTSRAFKLIKSYPVPAAKAKNKAPENNEPDDISQIGWIPENVLRIIEEKGDQELMRTLSKISKEIEREATLQCSNENNENLDMLDELATSADEHGISRTDNEPHELIVLDDNDYKTMCTKLNELCNSDKFTFVSLKETLCTAEKLKKLTRLELDLVAEYIKGKQSTFTYKKSLLKAEKVNIISKIIGDGSTIQISSKCGKTKVSTLKNLCIAAVNSTKVSKATLNIAYAKYIFPDRLDKWLKNSKLSSVVMLAEKHITMEWFSQPEINPSTGELLCKCLDSHHLLTNLRTKTSTTGIDGISPRAWKKVAHSYKTRLTPAMVDDLIDKQSNSFAQTHFSEDVEHEMLRNGDTNEANFCRLIRNWYEAEDSPAISVADRIQKWLNLREYLLENVDFSTFPPQLQFIKGLSVIAFEGFLTGIDSKIQLYGLCGGSYCVRTASSLPAETCVGVIQDLNINNAVAVKAKDVPHIISTLTEIMTYKCNPNRGFHMMTSRAPVYPIVEGLQPGIESNLETDIGGIVPRDHTFDARERRRSKPHRKSGTISQDLDTAPLGAQPMRRLFFKCDESKIDPLKRSGLFEKSVDENKIC